VTLKVVPKPNCSSEYFSITGYDMYTGEIRPMTAKESRNQNSDAASEQSLDLVSVFKEASKNL
jgi:hypothetical protein